MTRRVVIEHKDGRRFQVTLADYRNANVAPEGEPKRTYRDEGFRIVAWADGEPYEEPKAAKGGKGTEE